MSSMAGHGNSYIASCACFYAEANSMQCQSHRAPNLSRLLLTQHEEYSVLCGQLPLASGRSAMQPFIFVGSPKVMFMSKLAFRSQSLTKGGRAAGDACRKFDSLRHFWLLLFG